MSMLPESTNEASATIVSRKALPAPTLDADSPKRRRGFFRAVGAFLGFIHDYTAADIGRLKEAAIQEVEARPLNARSESELKIAEAAERHARAEQLRAEAEKARAEAQQTRANAAASYLKAHAEHAATIADAMAQVIESIARIKQQGGEVAFDEQQLLRLIEMGEVEAPRRISSEPKTG